MSKIPILPWESILRKLTRHGEHLLESCHQTDEVWAYDSPRCSRPPEKKMWEKACSVSIRLERTRVNYPVQSCAASGTQTSSLKASVALSALLCPWLSLWVLLKWTRKFVSRFSIQISLPRGEKIELLRSGKLHLFLVFYILFYWSTGRGLFCKQRMKAMGACPRAAPALQPWGCFVPSEGSQQGLVAIWP